ncbi:MAG: hypothetical protein A3C07_05050 [Candidatus Sungbacteria bacterium RIFCSPHIGHO2_02_FULL_47_11]|uniref:Uncharacterized protein n=1 Tax=Candidatus Sungbacteria bacterium RIFCSPHIGHO2_02_FULL_47_11 TaxID=1802270 RepID=A0A1G2KQ12_9BACT|nr:MAG: hypothetical protein A3C07_05050 [Candidatus Sungbacteria bacterium RIFCSPHIGHO2_02_FULL_47_11]
MNIYTIEPDDTLWGYYKCYFLNEPEKFENPSNLCVYVRRAIGGFFTKTSLHTPLWRIWATVGLFLLCSVAVFTLVNLAENSGFLSSELFIQLTAFGLFLPLILATICSLTFATFISGCRMAAWLGVHAQRFAAFLSKIFAPLFFQIIFFGFLSGAGALFLYAVIFHTERVLRDLPDLLLVLGICAGFVLSCFALDYSKNMKAVQTILAYLLAVKRHVCPLVSAPKEKDVG